MGKRRSLIRWRPDSPFAYCNFTVKGHRFRGSLETDDAELAETLAARIRERALLGPGDALPEMSLDEAFGRYWLERGHARADSDDITLFSKAWLRILGKGLLLSNLTTDVITEATARLRVVDRRRRGKAVQELLSNGRTNRYVEYLRAVAARARDVWQRDVAKVSWGPLLLEEPENVQHILTADEEERLFAKLRPDFHGLVRFALVAGVRVENAIGLAWSQVDWDSGTIWLRVKSRKPGKALRALPITPALAAILSVERGRHPTRVFTYLCARNRFDPERKRTQRKGQRYTFTRDGWRKPWAEAVAAAELGRFRFHDLRHTAGTRALRASGNLRSVQKMLGHTDISTTVRYAVADTDDVRAAMEAVERAARNRPTADAPPPKASTGSRA